MRATGKDLRSEAGVPLRLDERCFCPRSLAFGSMREDCSISSFQAKKRVKTSERASRDPCGRCGEVTVVTEGNEPGERR